LGKNLQATPLQGGSYRFKSCRAHHSKALLDFQKSDGGV